MASWKTAISRIGQALLLVTGSGLLACEALPKAAPCIPCQEECPGDLDCRDGICVKPGEEEVCDEQTNDSTADGITSDSASNESSATGSRGGSGGSAGEAGAGNTTSTTGTGGGGGSGGVAGSTSSSVGGTGSGPCEVQPTSCLPELVPLSEVAACANRPFSFELRARCECDDPDLPERSGMVWKEVGDVEGVEVSLEGSVAGTLAPGRHTLSVQAALGSDLGLWKTFDLELDVAERCLVTFISEEESPDVPRVAAVRVDTHEFEGWMPDDPDAAVVSYDISTDGRYLATVLDGGDTLDLFALDQPGVPSIDFEHVGAHLAHAFSRDSHWLALVTTNPDDLAKQLLTLVRFDGATWTQVDQDSFSYWGGLDWFGDNQILYMERPDDYYPDVTPFSQTAGDDGLSNRVQYQDLLSGVYDIFNGFLIGPQGFMMSTYLAQGYFDRATLETYVYFDPIEAVSPGLNYRALLDSGMLAVDPLAREDEAAAYAAGEGCGVLRAWSQNDTALLCSSGTSYDLFELEGEPALIKTQLDASAYSWPSWRASVSATASWVAFLPTPAGLHVVPRSRYGQPLPELPFLDTRNGGWDFFFSPSEKYLVIQQGERLLVAALNEDGPAEPNVLSQLMGPVPVCEPTWSVVDAGRWCGAAHVAGSAELSVSERYLAFHELEGRVQLVDLTSMALKDVGRLALNCPKDCIQFQ